MRTRVCDVCFNEKPLSDFDSKVNNAGLWTDSVCIKCRQMGRKPLKELIAESNATIKAIKKQKSDSVKRMGGVYLLIKDGKIIYIGESSHLLSRLQNHHYGFGCQVLFIKCSNAEERLKLESELINKYNPRFNKNNYAQFISTITLEDLYKMYPK